MTGRKDVEDTGSKEYRVPLLLEEMLEILITILINDGRKRRNTRV